MIYIIDNNHDTFMTQLFNRNVTLKVQSIYFNVFIQYKKFYSKNRLYMLL